MQLAWCKNAVVYILASKSIENHYIQSFVFIHSPTNSLTQYFHPSVMKNTKSYTRDVKMWLSESFLLITSSYRFRCVRWNWGRTSWLWQKQPLQHSPNKRAVVDWPCLVISFIHSGKRNILLLFIKARRNVWYVRKYWVWILISLCYFKMHSRLPEQFSVSDKYLSAFRIRS